MIAVVKTGDYIRGALKYNLDKVASQEAEIIGSVHCICNGFDETGKDITIEQINRSFTPYLQANNRTKNVVFSCSLNPHPEEAKQMDNDTLLEMARDYMSGMGYSEQPYIVVKHEDIDRPHIHIISLRVDVNGKKINDSMERARSNRVRQQLESKYGLMSVTQSSIESTREEKSERISKYIERNKLTNESEDKHKKKIKSILTYVRDYYKPQDIKEMNKILRQFSLICKEIDETNNKGQQIRGIQYVKIDGSGREEGRAYKGSLFGKEQTIEGLKTYFAINKQYDKEREKVRADIREQIDKELSTKEVTSIYALAAKLQEKAIKMDLHSNVEGRLMGVTFIDNATGYAIKGSELGKGYAISSLQKKTAEEDKPIRTEPRIEPVKRDLRHGETDIKKKIEACLKEVKETYNPKDMAEFNSILSNYHIKCSEIQGKTKAGKPFRGCVYSLIDDGGKTIGHNHAGSLFGKEHTIHGLEQRFNKTDRLTPSEYKAVFTTFAHLYNFQRKATFFESDLISQLSENRYVEEAGKNNPNLSRTALAGLAKQFIAEKREKLREIEEKEKSYIQLQMQYSVRFATLLSEEKRYRYFQMSDIHYDGQRFINTKNTKYSFTWQELAMPMKEEKITLHPFHTIRILKTEKSDSRLGKKDKELVKAFVTGDWSKVDLTDRRNNFYQVQQLLGEAEKKQLQIKQNDSQAQNLMDRFSIHGTEKMVGEMLTRGIVILPATTKNNERTYVIGNSQNPKSTYVELPPEVRKELDKMNYATTFYPHIRKFVYVGNSDKLTQKYRVTANLTTAMDYSDDKMAERIIDNVNRYNPELADEMRKYKNKTTDYRGMIDVVLRYTGDKTKDSKMDFLQAIRTNDAKTIKRTITKIKN
ncbi:MAG: relaxase/mobilization nuclease domain-containing protein [Paludibacteraceae bacterium]|nr:relaxase/mobilization nuclease domain-containing protein [Paludibacteraceae bacterium]HOU68683.1 relaxase/mobilization nuclease domain-containing protein [Paludibacteraceae bacterium]HQJ89226.1 relaxase/mobilization nuclease domain-containing protein [Paludibacteraceae bacterium]